MARESEEVLHSLVNDLDSDVSGFDDDAAEDLWAPEDEHDDHIPANWQEKQQDFTVTSSDETEDLEALGVKDDLKEYFVRKIAEAREQLAALEKQNVLLAQVLDRLELATAAAARDVRTKRTELVTADARCKVAKEVAAKRKAQREGEIRVVKLLIDKVDELHSKNHDKVADLTELSELASSAMGLDSTSDLEAGQEPSAGFVQVMTDLSQGKKYGETIKVRGLLIKLMNALITEAGAEDVDQKRECGKIAAARKLLEGARTTEEETKQNMRSQQLARETKKTQIVDQKKAIEELLVEKEKVDQPSVLRKELEVERRKVASSAKEVEELRQKLKAAQEKLLGSTNSGDVARGLGDATLSVTKGIESWVKADSGVRKDSAGRVIEWRDSSSKGNTLVQEKEDKRPKYGAHCGPGGTPCIMFDGINDILTNRQFKLASGAVSVFAVFRLKDFTQHKNYPFSLGDHNPGVMAMESEGSNSQLDIAFGWGNDKKFTMPTKWDGQTYRSFTVRGDSKNNIKVTVDGKDASMSGSPSGAIPAFNRMSMGGLDFAMSHPERNTPVDFSELIVYNRKVTDAEAAEVEKYLNKRWLSNGGGNTVPFQKYNELGKQYDNVKEALQVCQSNGAALGSAKNPALSCKAIRQAKPNENMASGHYYIKNPFGHGSIKAYCDMSFRGGGWTLISQSVKGVRDAYDLRNGGGSYETCPRGKQTWTIPNAKVIAHHSEEILISRSSSDSYAGSISDSDAVSYFRIPAPKEVTFANPSYRRNFDKGPCVEVMVYDAKNSACKEGCKRFTYKYSLGTSWTDGFPTGIGALPTRCYGPGATDGPMITTDDTGTGNPGYIGRWGKSSTNGGTTSYWHRGLWDTTGSNHGGQGMIWLR